jgi:hypothetical protein
MGEGGIQAWRDDVIKAHVQETESLLAVRMTIAQMAPDNEWHPTHIMRYGPGPWDVIWSEITDPLAVQDPTLTLDTEAARALYEALRVHYGDTTRNPVIILHAGEEFTEEKLRQLGDTITDAIRRANK